MSCDFNNTFNDGISKIISAYKNQNDHLQNIISDLKETIKKLQIENKSLHEFKQNILESLDKTKVYSISDNNIAKIDTGSNVINDYLTNYNDNYIRLQTPKTLKSNSDIRNTNRNIVKEDTEELIYSLNNSNDKHNEHDSSTKIINNKINSNNGINTNYLINTPSIISIDEMNKNLKERQKRLLIYMRTNYSNNNYNEILKIMKQFNITTKEGKYNKEYYLNKILNILEKIDPQVSEEFITIFS